MDILAQVRRFMPGAARPEKASALLVDRPFHSSAVVSRVEAALVRGQHVVLIYLDLARFRDFETTYGMPMARAVLARVEKALEELTPKVISSSALLAIQNLWGDDFAVYVTTATPSDDTWLERTRQLLLTALVQRLKGEFPALPELKFHCAWAYVQGPAIQAPSQIYQAVRQAMKLAKGTSDLGSVEALREFQELVSVPLLYSVYQPIVELSTARIHGWEALVRTPSGSRFRGPDSLFRFARETEQTWTLERACRRAALSGMDTLAGEQRLFLNVDADSINDPQFIHGDTMALLRERGIHPRNVVFEITERTSIGDFSTFRRVLQHYRSQGYQVAVDDVGAGYSSLQSIAELRPDYMKLDMSLVQQVQNSTMKQAILETFVSFAGKIGCSLIAEGIETPEELRALAGLGVHYGQGYYLARPTRPAPAISDDACITLEDCSRIPRRSFAAETPLEQFLESTVTVPPTALVKELAARFEADEQCEGIVVLEGARPAGLVMRNRLYRRLGVPFGVPLHYEKPVVTLMDRVPLTAEADLSLEQVSRLVTGRDSGQAYDFVVVTKNGDYQGILSVHRILRTLTEARLSNMGAVKEYRPL